MVFGLFLCIGHIAGIPNFNDMQPRFMVANHGIEQLLEQENKFDHSNGSAIYPGLHY